MSYNHSFTVYHFGIVSYPRKTASAVSCRGRLKRSRKSGRLRLTWISSSFVQCPPNPMDVQMKTGGVWRRCGISQGTFRNYTNKYDSMAPSGAGGCAVLKHRPSSR